jgi:hypothetical protein
MQISLQDLRALGYEKIFHKYYKSDEDFIAHVTRLQFCDIESCSAFSLPRKWNDITVLDEYYGMKSFMQMCEPMIDDIPVTQAIQRRFRNKWESFWGSIQDALGISDSYMKILSHFGIGLSFLDKDYEIFKSNVSIYNDLMLWYLLVQNESCFEILDLTPFKLLEFLVTLNEDEFMKKVRSFL